MGRRGQALLAAAGHDVSTVLEQELTGASDEVIFKICADEGRALVTLDHDFAQVLRFPPHLSAGIVVLELPGRATLESLHQRLQEFLRALTVRPLGRELWIVEPARVRIHQRDDFDGNLE